MGESHQTALELVPETMAQVYKLVPLSYDGKTLRIAITAGGTAELDDVRLFLGVSRMEAETWPPERVAAALAEAYPAGPPPPVPRFAAVWDFLDGLLAVGSAVLCWLAAWRVRRGCSLAMAEGIRCLCGRRLEIGFHPSGRVLTVHCPSFRHAFIHFDAECPPVWWRERVHYDWLCGEASAEPVAPADRPRE